MFKMLQNLFRANFKRRSPGRENIQPSIGQQHAIDATTRRRTNREKTSQTGVVWVTLIDQTRLNVADVSYGGMSLICDEAKLQPYINSNGTLEVTLHVYHLSMPCEVVVIHGYEGHTGCSFIHSKPDNLLFLRQVLEFIRMGSTVMPLPIEVMRSQYQGGGYHMFQGDRGTEVVVKAAGVADVESVELRFRDGNSDNRVQYQKGQMTYHRYRNNADDDHFLCLQQGFFILLGFMERYPHYGFETVAQTFRAEIDKFQKDLSHRRPNLTA